MPESREIVTNTGPLLALVAATGDLHILDDLYERVVVPQEVAQEMTVDNASRFGAAEFESASWLIRKDTPAAAAPSLANTLGPGEAAVIHWALAEHAGTVCIDESIGRRVARLNGLRVTGSLGILMRAKRE